MYAALAGALVLDHRQYEGRVYPGVSMLEMDLGGTEPLGVVGRLDAATDGGGIATYSFELDGRPPGEAPEVGPGASPDPKAFLWRGRELGVDFDVYESAQRAYGVGRTGSVVERLGERVRSRVWALAPFGLEPRRVAPDISYRPTAAGSAVGEMARELDRDPEDARLEIDGQGPSGGGDPGPIVVPHTRGLRVSEEGTLGNLNAALLELKTRVGIEATRPYPRILTPAAEEAAARADRALSGGPLVVEDPGARPFGAPTSQQVPRSALAGLLVVTPEPERGRIAVSADGAAVAAALDPIVGAAARDPEDASLYFDANTGEVEVEPSREGRAPDGEALRRDVARSLLSGRKGFTLSVDELEPSFSTQEAAAVRPEDLLGGYTTAYRPGGGPAEEVRFGNLSAAAAAVDGSLVPPGGTFSLLSALGEEGLSPSSFSGGPDGYVSDPSRPERPPVDDSAGLSQVASTLHAAALLSGLSITERSQAPEGSPPLPYVDGGIEAHVGAGEAGATDLAFRNDTEAYLLVRAETDGAGQVGVRIEGRSDAFAGSDAGPAREISADELDPDDPAFPEGAQEAWTVALVDSSGERRTVSGGTNSYSYDAVEPQPEPEPEPEPPAEEEEPEAPEDDPSPAEDDPSPAEEEPEAPTDEVPEEGPQEEPAPPEDGAEEGPVAAPDISPEISPEATAPEGTTPAGTPEGGEAGASSMTSENAP